MTKNSSSSTNLIFEAIGPLFRINSWNLKSRVARDIQIDQNLDFGAVSQIEVLGRPVDVMQSYWTFVLNNSNVQVLITAQFHMLMNDSAMTSFFSPFSRSRGGNAWFSVGLATSFPDVATSDAAQIRDLRPCGNSENIQPGCKVFHVPKDDSSGAREVILDSAEAPPPEAGGLRDQVLVFRYKEKFHAINHVRIPSQYSL